jgi:hypothetical protein
MVCTVASAVVARSTQPVMRSVADQAGSTASLRYCRTDSSMRSRQLRSAWGRGPESSKAGQTLLVAASLAIFGACWRHASTYQDLPIRSRDMPFHACLGAVRRLQLAAVDDSKAPARLRREGGNEVAGLGHAIHETDGRPQKLDPAPTNRGGYGLPAVSHYAASVPSLGVILIGS